MSYSFTEKKRIRKSFAKRSSVLPVPYLLSDGTLVIPFNSPERYHWWKGGQSVRQTRAELLAQCHHERKEQDAVTV